MTMSVQSVVTGAVEGDLDEAVLRRVVSCVGITLGTVHGRQGKPALLQSVRGYNNAAPYAPWIVVVDLDRDCDCAPPCHQKWLPSPAPLMCFRVAVRAIEAWILADRTRAARVLGVNSARVPPDPDGLDDPKDALVNIARRSRRRSVREGLVPREGSSRRVGPLYNAILSEFVQDASEGWRPESAMENSQSLVRCVEHLRRIVEVTE